MVESEVVKDSSAGNSSAPVNIRTFRTLLLETLPTSSTHDSSGLSDDSDFAVSKVTYRDGSTVYLLNNRVIEEQQLAEIRDITSSKITFCKKSLDLTKRNIIKLQLMIELNRERLSKMMQLSDDWQLQFDDARKLMDQLQNPQQFSNKSSKTQDTREETEQNGATDVPVTMTSVSSVYVVEANSLSPQQLLQTNVEDGWLDAPSLPFLPDESSEIGLDGIQTNQVSASTTFDFNNSDHQVHNDDGSNDVDQSSVSSFILSDGKRENRKRKSELSSVAAEEQEDTKSTTSSITPAKKSRLSSVEKNQKYQQLMAQFLVRDKRETLEEYKKRKVEVEELKEMGLHPQPVAVNHLWIPLSAYVKKHNIRKDNREVRNDACTLCGMSVDELTSKFGLTTDEARLLHGIFL